MKLLAFSGRTAKEILRDPLNLAFGIGFPVVLLLLLSAIQANIPVSLFEIQQLAPGIAVFGLAFFTLFSATLVARDRESAFLARLYTTPLPALDFILGYLLPLLPMFLLTLKNDKVVRTDCGDRPLLYLMIVMDLYVVIRIFSIVCLRVS